MAAIMVTACTSDQSTGKPGQALAAGDYVLTVTNVENPAQGPDRFTNPKPGNRLVKFDITMSNTGGLILPVWASYFALHDSGGIDNPARTDVSGDQYLKQRTIAPGGSTQATMYFEMAGNERAERLVFAPAILGWHTAIAVNLTG